MTEHTHTLDGKENLGVIVERGARITFFMIECDWTRRCQERLFQKHRISRISDISVPSKKEVTWLRESANS